MGGKRINGDRTCDLCDGLHYARGRCKRHYNQLPDQVAKNKGYEQARRVQRRAYDRNRGRDPVIAARKRDYLREWQRRRAMPRWAAWWEAQRRAEDQLSVDLVQWVGQRGAVGSCCRLVSRPQSRFFVGSWCKGCGVAWVQYAARDDGVYCAPCNKRRWRHDCNHRRRLRLTSAVREVVSADEVFKRDGYRCQLCGRKTRGEFPGPLSPTLDHIIPLAKGGEHSHKNVQCACFTCNSRKGMQSANDQLRLVG